MSLLKCQVNNKMGWKNGATGTCFVGPGARAKAVKQGRAIKASQSRNDEVDDAVMKIRFRQAQGNVKPKKKPPAKLPEWLYPFPVERQYEKELLNYVDALTTITEKQITVHIPSLVEERNRNVPEGSRSDDYADDAERLVNSVNLSFVAVEKKFNPAVSALVLGGATNVWNEKEWQKQLKAAFGINVFQREPFISSTINSFTKENTSLITKMTADYKNGVGEAVQRGLRQGQSTVTITKALEKQGGLTKNRARLIARDQVGKLNGQLTELKQTNLGVRSYTWRDSGDSRVRPTHISNNGRVFTWDKPPFSTGHPGQDFQCRCYAEPNLEEVFDELGLAA